MEPVCVIMQNFVKIGQTVLELKQCNQTFSSYSFSFLSTFITSSLFYCWL